MTLPPGVSATDFNRSLQRFKEVVGPDWVFEGADADLYRDAYSPLWSEASEKVASAAVAPSSVEQVRKILAIANELRIPLYPISTGRNLAYGGSAPAYSGSVVLDLKRMNRVLEVNERNAYALVEPGVSYFDLYRHIREKKLKLWIDCPDPGWGSLIGNALDHGAGLTPLPYRDHFDAHCGMEVVLANGEIVRTGMGALPGAQTWQHFKYGIGPQLDGLFSQSNFGVVTKMGFWLYPEPEAYRSLTVRAAKYRDLVPLIDTLANLMYSGVVNCQIGIVSPVINAPGPPSAEFTALVSKADGGTDEEWDRYAASRNVHFWQTHLQFYGPSRVIDAQVEHTRERFGAIPGVTFVDGVSHRFPLSDEQIAQITNPVALGIPSLQTFGGILPGPGEPPSTGHMDFSLVLPMTGEAVMAANKVFRREFSKLAFTPKYGIAESYHWRSLILFFGFPVSHDVEENRKIRDSYGRMIEIAAEHGWGLYRTHTAFMDAAVGKYAYNNHALLRLQERLKDAIDPNGVLSAGRYGIWPKHLRGKTG